MIEIKHKETGEVLKRVEADTLARVDLTGASLSGANLAGADLQRAYLVEAKLADADLRRAKLTDAYLMGADLTKADLRNADLTSANLESADLTQADFTQATLILARLVAANLTEANLTNADLSEADLLEAKLIRADLSEASLRSARLEETSLAGARLKGAIMGQTSFNGCLDLHEAFDLDAVRHRSPSMLDARTLRACVRRLDYEFLRRVGYTDDEVENLKGLYTTPIQFYKVFLSHGSADAEFADLLRRDLEAKDVHVWHFRHDMSGGRYWRAQINDAIKVYDKLLLVCSRHSVKRDNVVYEILEAMDRERQYRERKLFPVRLDNYIIGKTALEFGDEQVRKDMWPENWIRYVQRHHVPDFSRWKDRDSYLVEFRKLLQGMTQPAAP